MKAFAMLGLNRVGWIEKPRPSCGPLDAIVRPIAVSPCTSDVHTVFEGALGDRRDMILGHEAVGEVVDELGPEVGEVCADGARIVGDSVRESEVRHHAAPSVCRRALIAPAKCCHSLRCVPSVVRPWSLIP